VRNKPFLARIPLKPNRTIYKILLPHSQDQLKAQAGSIESMEAKAGYLIASDGIILTIASTLFMQKPEFLTLFMRVGTACLIVSILLILGVFWNRYFHMGLPISNFYDEFNKKSDNVILFKALYTINLALEHNAYSLKWKSRFFIWSLIFFILSLFLFTAGLVFDKDYHYNRTMDNQRQQNTTNHNVNQNQSQGQEIASPSEQGQITPKDDIWSVTHQTAGTTPSNLIKGGEDASNR